MTKHDCKKLGHHLKPIIQGNGKYALDEAGHIKKYCERLIGRSHLSG